MRDSKIDNIKGLMIFLVLFAHIISNLYGRWLREPSTKYLYYLIYSFHMPVMIFCSGYLSKRKTDFGTYAKKAIASCLIPFLVFNVLYAIPSPGKMLNLFAPQWTLWFLLSLFFWKIMGEVVEKVRWALVIAVIFALYAGFVSKIGNYLSLSRTICFFPFFLAGKYLSEEGFEKIRKLKKLIPVAAALAIGVIIFILVKYQVPYRIFFMNGTYRALKQSNLHGILFRCLAFALGFLGCFFFFAVIPKRKSFFTMFGQYSITIYLGHSLVITLLKRLRVLRPIRNPAVFIGIDLALALAICFMLGNKYVAKGFRWVMGKIASIFTLT